MSNKWDNRFIELAKLVSTWSKDRSRQTACIIVGPDREIRSTGYNGFPRGIADSAADVETNIKLNAGWPSMKAYYEDKKILAESRHERPLKYQWTEHAERNAIYNAARMGLSTKGCTAYIPWYPCADCARALVQSGINTLVAYQPDFEDPKWGSDFKQVKMMLEEAGINVRYVEGQKEAAK